MFRRRDTKTAGGGAASPDTAAVPAPRLPLLPTYPPNGYLGQLDPAFQAALSKRREGANLDDFVWYHATELPDGTVLPGVWDLRGHESAYLGGVDVRGQARARARTGHRLPDLLHGAHGRRGRLLRGRVRRAHRHAAREGRGPARERLRVMQETIDRNHDAWWYLHRAFGSSAKFVQGNIYDMPADLGHLRHHRGRGHPAAPARAVGGALAGGPAHDRDHGRHRAAAGRPRPTRVEHHALLPLGRAPPHQLVVDLPRRRGLHAGAAAASGRPRPPCTPSDTTWPMTSGAMRSISACTRWSVGPSSDRRRPGRPASRAGRRVRTGRAYPVPAPPPT